MTTGEFSHSANLDPRAEYLKQVETHVNILAPAAQAGFFGEIADVKARLLPELGGILEVEQRTPKAVFETILKRPDAGEPASPRGELVKLVAPAVTAAAIERGGQILDVVTRIGMRRAEGSEENYERISAADAIFVAEGGANKTSVVRRGVAEKAMHALYGDNLSGRTLHQFGAKRVIQPTAMNPQTKVVGPNPEYTTIRSLAGEFLPANAPFTEYDANLATALADGYEMMEDVSDHSGVGLSFLTQEMYHLDSAVSRVTHLLHLSDPSRPALLLVQPSGNGLEGGLDAIRAFEPLEGKQFVIATNGQYRPKDELQALQWATERGIAMTPAVALGDEPGDAWTYKGEPMVTPARPVGAYVNEIALYGQQTLAFVVATNKKVQAHTQLLGYRLPGSIGRELPDGTLEVVEPNGQSWVSYDGRMYYKGPNDLMGMSE